MKSSLFLLGVAAGAVAQPHGHQHKRSHQHHNHVLEDRALVEELVTVTVVECVLNGKVISEKECNDGVASGRLRWVDDGKVEEAPPVVKIQPAVHAEGAKASPSPSPAAPPPPPAPAAAPPPPPAPAAPAPEANNRVAHSSFSTAGSAAAAARSFPSGQLSCNTFPAEYGAVPVDYLGLNGWLSIQAPRNNYKRTPGFDNIMTKIPSMCSNGNCCSEGTFCSYACPSGYFKAQWPTTQGHTGQSVGGLLCQNGRLVTTNPSTDKLCVKGATQVSAFIENKLDQVVSLCQTNYPGDEAMTVPTVVEPGARVEIPIIDSTSYWRTTAGGATTAQFYLNPAGVGADRACRWASAADGNIGNWAPLVIGAGWNGNMAYMSLFGNRPTTNAYLDYKVETTGSGSIPCKYENRQICMYEGFGTCKDPLADGGGCTIAVAAGGTINYVLSR